MTAIRPVAPVAALCGWLGVALLLVWPAPQPAAAADASDPFFTQGEIPRLKIEIDAAELNKLRSDPRNYVRAKLIENDRTEYQAIGVKLKGAAGSFRGVDDKPALTLNMDKWTKKQSFHALDKFHLNNSVQDPGYLHELICSDLFNAAGIAAPRVTHARVWLNGRDLGLYVLKEGFDTPFLKRHFQSAKGNLYDGGFCQEIDGNLEKDSGDGPDDRSDLKALAAACRESDPALRWQKVGELVDIEKFLTFAAVELMTCHWDGYCNNRNNYRMYFQPGNSRWVFLPHGMDQMFGDTNASVLGTPGALVCQAVLSHPAWRARYRERVGELLPLFSPPDKLHARIDQVQARLQPVLKELNASLARDQAGHAQALKDRLAARARALEQQNAVAEPKPLAFGADGAAAIANWYPKSETADAKTETLALPGEPKTLAITCGESGRCVASWRAKVLLPAGTYQFRGRAKAQGVEPLVESSGAGAGLRISGGQRTNRLEGDADWQELAYDLTIGSPMQEVELVAELRATKGQVRFDAASLRIVQGGK